MSSDYSEDFLVEKPAVSLFSELGWETANCFYEKFHEIEKTIAVGSTGAKVKCDSQAHFT